MNGRNLYKIFTTIGFVTAGALTVGCGSKAKPAPTTVTEQTPEEKKNEPLKADIRMVMARIEPLAAARIAPDSPQAEVKQPDNNQMHVLLSNYERQGRIH